MSLEKKNKHSILILIGPPGVGKGTLAQTCKDRFNWNHVSTGLLCRKFSDNDDFIGRKIKDLIEKGSLIDDDLMLEMLTPDFELFFHDGKKNEKVILLDGFPRNGVQVEKLLNYLNTRYKNEEKEIIFVVFEATDKVILSRLENRKVCSNKKCERIYSKNDCVTDICEICGSLLIKRKDDDIGIIENRLKVYHQNSDAIFKVLNFMHLKPIRLAANVPKEDLFKEFSKKINKFVEINLV